MITVGYGEENPAFRHGHNCRGKRSTEYESWVGIRARCLNPKNKLFPYYGGRGITMSPSWQESFSNFLTDMGMRPARGFSVERKNNNLGYSKENCIWANKMQQSRNRRNNIVVSFKGRSMCLKEACQIAGVDYKKAWRRFRAGWPVHLVLENG